MNNSEIQILFPTPGDWTKLIMSVIYVDTLGFTHIDQYDETTMPKEQIPALAEAIEAIAALDEQWQACQVWARMGWVPSSSSPTDRVPAVLLTVEATGDSGGTKIFTPDQYPQFVLTDSGTLSFFNFFTKR